MYETRSNTQNWLMSFSVENGVYYINHRNSEPCHWPKQSQNPITEHAQRLEQRQSVVATLQEQYILTQQ